MSTNSPVTKAEATKDAQAAEALKRRVRVVEQCVEQTYAGMFGMATTDAALDTRVAKLEAFLETHLSGMFIKAAADASLSVRTAATEECIKHHLTSPFNYFTDAAAAEATKATKAAQTDAADRANEGDEVMRLVDEAAREFSETSEASLNAFGQAVAKASAEAFERTIAKVFGHIGAAATDTPDEASEGQPLVFDETPFSKPSGSTESEATAIKRHIHYLDWTRHDCAARGETALDSHGSMTRHFLHPTFYVSDYDDKWDVLTREQAMTNAHAIRRACTKTVFYTDMGWSNGMKSARDYCIKHNLPFEERTVDLDRMAAAFPNIPEQMPHFRTKFANLVDPSNPLPRALALANPTPEQRDMELVDFGVHATFEKAKRMFEEASTTMFEADSDDGISAQLTQNKREAYAAACRAAVDHTQKRINATKSASLKASLTHLRDTYRSPWGTDSPVNRFEMSGPPPPLKTMSGPPLLLKTMRGVATTDRATREEKAEKDEKDEKDDGDKEVMTTRAFGVAKVFTEIHRRHAEAKALWYDACDRLNADSNFVSATFVEKCARGFHEQCAVAYAHTMKRARAVGPEDKMYKALRRLALYYDDDTFYGCTMKQYVDRDDRVKREDGTIVGAVDDAVAAYHAQIATMPLSPNAVAPPIFTKTKAPTAPAAPAAPEIGFPPPLPKPSFDQHKKMRGRSVEPTA